jgi:site-specific DNA-methyltransferase (adenine-specific)
VVDIKTKHRIIIGDSRKMDAVGDESIHLIVTSPPYWQLKDYGNGGQIGFDDSYEEYINNLNLVWKESYRILENGCRLCINIGDQFARSVYYGRYKIIPIRTEIIKFCETIGFDYMGAIIWQKVTTTNTTGGATIMGSFPYPRNGIIKIDYEFILIFKKGGKPKKIDSERKKMSKLTKEEWNEYFYGHWNFSGEKQGKHLAMFPVELPHRLIKMFTFVGDTVLDPFLGSGTTSLSANILNRNSVGYELNHEFLPIIKKKTGAEEPDLFGKNDFIIERQNQLNLDFDHDIQKLPYVFKDPVKMDKKIDPRKLQFGSRIDKKSQTDVKYYHVKRIMSPNTLELNNGLIIKLLGVDIIEDKKSDAIDFLIQKTKGQKVFIKFDETKYDKYNNLLCYLYLKNKTFINAHLVKSGLVTVDSSSEFKYKSNFKRYLGVQNGKRVDS